MLIPFTTRRRAFWFGLVPPPFGSASVVRVARVVCWVLAVGLAPRGGAECQEWTRFRGPNGSGVAEAGRLSAAFTERDFAWKVELAGEGISSPVCLGDNIFVTSARETPERDAADGRKVGDDAAPAGERYLQCLRRDDGSEAWRRTAPFEPYKKHRVNSFAASTPAVDDARVYVAWQSAKASSLVAYTLKGEVAWTRDLGPFPGDHGGASSPIVVDDLVIIAVEHEGPSAVLAFDRRTGEERWRAPRRSARATYATPCARRLADGATEVILTHWRHGVTALDARTGAVRWEIGVFGDGEERSIASPVLAGELVLGTCGFITGKKHSVAVKPPESSKDAPREVYRVELGAPQMPTPLVVNGLLFLWTEKGVLTCADAATGAVCYQRRIGGSFASSPVAAGGQIHCVDENGDVLSLPASKEFTEPLKSSLGEGSRATPAIADGTIYFRTFRHLLAVPAK